VSDAPAKILVIEDEEDIRELLAYQLRRDDYPICYGPPQAPRPDPIRSALSARLL